MPRFHLSALYHRVWPGLAFFLLIFPACHEHPYRQGEVLYRYHCANCHMDDGSGLSDLIPPLDRTAISPDNPEKLVCLIIAGIPKSGSMLLAMPANPGLSDAELTNLVNYLGFVYGSRPQTVKANEVKALRLQCGLD